MAKSKKKERILDAAGRLFAAKGFKDTSVHELAELTDAAEGTIFYHFKNKEELFIAVLDGLRTEITHDFEEFLSGREFASGLEMVEEVISFYFLWAAHNEERYMLLYRHFPYALARVNPTCREHLEAIYNCLVDMFEVAVAKGQEDGTITKSPQRKTALLLFTLADGLVRFRTYDLYDSGALVGELLASCRKMLTNPKPN